VESLVKAADFATKMATFQQTRILQYCIGAKIVPSLFSLRLEPYLLSTALEFLSSQGPTRSIFLLEPVLWIE
jgi:hypothetical protein